jgi:hypothetical protein
MKTLTITFLVVLPPHIPATPSGRTKLPYRKSLRHYQTQAARILAPTKAPFWSQRGIILNLILITKMLNIVYRIINPPRPALLRLIPVLQLCLQPLNAPSQIPTAPPQLGSASQTRSSYSSFWA